MNNQDIEKLSDSAMIEIFNQIVDNMIVNDSVGEAKELIVFLSGIFSNNQQFNKINPQLFKIYQDFIVAAKYVIIFELTENEIVNLIRENFYFVLNHPEYDLDRKVKYKIRSIVGLNQRDIFKKEIRRALFKCKAILSKNKIIINGEKHNASVANWLKDYYMTVGLEKINTLKLNEYLTSSKNIKLLSPEEKIKLKKLLDFFENLKVSSVQFPMFEETFVAILPDEEISLMSYEKMETISPKTLKLYNEVKNINNLNQGNFVNQGNGGINELRQLIAQYPAGSLERKAVEEEMRKLNTK